MNLHMADFDSVSAQKKILLVLLRAERPLHPRVIEDFVPQDFLIRQHYNSKLPAPIHRLNFYEISDEALLPLVAQYNHRKGVSDISQV
jgi:hypothetical protein